MIFPSLILSFLTAFWRLQLVAGKYAVTQQVLVRDNWELLTWPLWPWVHPSCWLSTVEVGICGQQGVQSYCEPDRFAVIPTSEARSTAEVQTYQAWGKIFRSLLLETCVSFTKDTVIVLFISIYLKTDWIGHFELLWCYLTQSTKWVELRHIVATPSNAGPSHLIICQWQADLCDNECHLWHQLAFLALPTSDISQSHDKLWLWL